MNNSKKVTWAHAFLSGTRMLIGAIGTLFLVSNGVELSQVALLQMLFSVFTFLLEIPTGAVADMFSGKLSVLFSVACFGLYYLIVGLLAPAYAALVIAQLIYALGLCFVSGAFEKWQMELVKMEFPGNSLMVNSFTHLKWESEAFIVMFSGTLGSVIAYLSSGNYRIVYMLCFILMIVLFFVFTSIHDTKPAPKENKKKLSSIYREYLLIIKTAANNIFKSKQGIFYIICTCMLVAIYQITYYQWQPLFVELAKSTNNIFFNKNIELLTGLVFFSYCFLRFVINKFARKQLIERYNIFKIAIVNALIASLALFVISLVKLTSVVPYVILFSLVQACSSVVESSIDSQFMKYVGTAQLASSISLISSVSRVGAIVFSGLLATFLNANNIVITFVAPALMFMLLIIPISQWKKI